MTSAGSDLPGHGRQSHPPTWRDAIALPLALASHVASTPLTLTRGGSIYIADASDDTLFVIRGAAKLVAHVGLDREQILSFHLAGDAICLSGEGAHQLELIAITECEIAAVERRSFADPIQSNAPALMLLLDRTTRSLQRSRDKAVALGRKSASERVADFLLSMAERIGIHEKGRTHVNLPMSRRDIADSLGLTIETVSRQLGELRAAQVIETRGRSQVTLIDIATLHSRAGRSRPANSIISRI